MDFKKLYIKQLNNHYCTARELQYNTKYDIFLNNKELNDYYNYIDNTKENFEKRLIKLELKTFNSKTIYFSNCIELNQSLTNLFSLLKTDYESNNDSLAIRNMPEIIKSRIYSELEGSLNIENVQTTRKRFDDIVLKNKKPENINDIIIQNMANGIDFVFKKPEFNKENLYKLYNILSKDSLDEKHILKKSEFYRYDDVFVDEYEGCPVEKIDECMNSLFDFVNKNINNNGFLGCYLPHIAHYYTLYIHPYFDFNGRTARMISLWIYLLMGKKTYPPFISDAINQTKKKYYSSLSESRNARNDITYFLMYVTNISIIYFLTYLNIENINKNLLDKGIVLTNLDKDYIKRILVSENGCFSYNDFILWNHIDISKQGAFKILNKFIEYGVLKEIKNKSNKKLFEIDKNYIIYRMNKYDI